MKLKNTANDPKPEWLMGGNPSAIEAQEAQGQRELLDSHQIPAKSNGFRDRSVIEQYELMGIRGIKEAKSDPLFLQCWLPKGWKKEGTDHSMWSKLIDDKGRERASFFYKAAFYDRDAFVNFSQRYIATTRYFEGEVVDGNNVKTAIVKDNATGEILFESEKHTWKNDDEFNEAAFSFLSKNFPNWKDVNAYWN